MDGIINVLKPPGMSSHDVVNFIRKAARLKKAGHTGTLDPGAAGVLVVCVGRATRLARFLAEDNKEYRAEIRLGAATSTGDSFGDVLEVKDASAMNVEQLKTALTFFTGEVRQIPPMASALKQQGRKLYELARAGQVVDRPARTVHIYSLRLVWSTGWGTPMPRALLHLSCSKGTYVRTLCEDIGKHIGCAAHMSFLVRTRAGAFKIINSKTIEEIQLAAQEGRLPDLLISMEEALSSMPLVMVNNSAIAAVSSGAKLYQPGVARMPEGLQEGVLVRLQGHEGLLAVASTELDPANKERIFFRPVCVLR
ncbi:MAG: tRNA pseudouridine(55) synthase TruB [Firmicutes bacterium]|nr:tRNA pseudouridine(55) synthase TruB [Bacillota bacterium]